MTTRTTAVPAIPLPDPALADGEVLLRPWRPADAGALARAWADDEVARWTGVPERTDRAAALRWIAGDADRRARGLALDLVVEVAGAVAGEVGLSGFDAGSRTVEVGWWVAPSHRGRGLATRAAGLVAAWAVAELSVDMAIARCDPANPASGAVARAAGFIRLDDTEVWAFAGAERRGTVPT